LKCNSVLKESSYVEVLHSVAELVASGEPQHEVIAVVRQHLIDLLDLLDLRDCRYEMSAPARPRFRIESTGDVLLGGAPRAVHVQGLPGPEVELPVQQGGKTVGRFVLRPTPGQPISRERRVVAIALADQVGAALRPRLLAA